jgi:hypothetical protein
MSLLQYGGHKTLHVATHCQQQECRFISLLGTAECPCVVEMSRQK